MLLSLVLLLLTTLFLLLSPCDWGKETQDTVTPNYSEWPREPSALPVLSRSAGLGLGLWGPANQRDK